MTSNGASISKPSSSEAVTPSAPSTRSKYKPSNFMSTQDGIDVGNSSKPIEPASLPPHLRVIYGHTKDGLTLTKGAGTKEKVSPEQQKIDNPPPHLRFMAEREKMRNAASTKPGVTEETMKALKQKFKNGFPPHVRAIFEAPLEKPEMTTSVADSAAIRTEIAPLPVEDAATKAVEHDKVHEVKDTGRNEAAPSEAKGDVINNATGKKVDEAYGMPKIDVKATEVKKAGVDEAKKATVEVKKNEVVEVPEVPVTQKASNESKQTATPLTASKPENEPVEKVENPTAKKMAIEARLAESMKETKLQKMPYDPDFTIGCQNLAIDEGFAARIAVATAEYEERQARSWDEEKAALRQRLSRRQKTIDLECADLTQELACNETKPSIVIARDRSEAGPFQMKPKDSRFWRWFIENSASLDSAEIEEAVKKELRDQFDAGDGTMLPASVEWDLREQFNSCSKPNIQRMNAWVEAAVKKAQEEPFMVDMTAQEFKDGSQPPSGLRQDDTIIIPKENPFHVIAPIYGRPHYPDTLPADDPWSHQPPRCDQTSAKSSEKYQATRIERLQQQIEFNRVQDMNLHISDPDSYHLKYFPGPDPNIGRPKNNPFAPKVDIFIRPAKQSDLAKIRDIYNYYVANTVHASEMQVTDIKEWEYRYGEAEKAYLPFLVAVLRNPKSGVSNLNEKNRKRGRKQGEANPYSRNYVEKYHFQEEKIVGFSLAERFGLANTGFDHTVELQLFVDHKYTHNGISKNLMDRMLPCLDPNYKSHSGTDLIIERGDNRRQYEWGGKAYVKKVVTTLFYSCEHEAEFKWKKENLEANYGFHQASFMHRIAEKFNKA